jgi:Putative beta-barrel porin 2
MRSGVVLLSWVVAAFGTATPLFAQVAPSAPGSNIWQTGSGPLPSLSSARQTPNQQPNAPAQPVSNQTAQNNAWPSWYPHPIGTPLAGGTLYTGVTVGTFYDDNVFATHTNRMDDWAFFARPEMQWFKQGQNYTVSADGFVEGRAYDRFSSEDQVNGGAGTNFTYMPDNNTQIVGGLRYLHEHLDRGSSETVVTIPGGGSALLSTQFAHPVAYDEGLQTIALNKRYGNWWSSIGGAGLEVQYQNATIGSGSAIAPSTPVDFGYADGGIGAVNGRLGYVIAPSTSVFVEAAGNTRQWQVGYFNSNGYRVVGGMLFEQGQGSRLKGEAWAGYMGQDYNGATMARVSSWTYGLDLSVLLVDDITAVFEGRREAKEAALGLAALPSGAIGASASTCTIDVAVCVSNIESEIGGRLDYRLTQNLVAGVGATYLEDDYQGLVSFGRVDRSFGPLASLKYFVSPNVTLGFDYRNLQFSSSGGLAPAGFTTVTALPYFRNIYMLSLNARW